MSAQTAPIAISPARDSTRPAAGIPPEPRREASRRRVLRSTLFLFGLACLAGVLATVGWSAVAANLARIGFWFFALVALYGVAQLAYATAWWVLTGPAPRPFTFGELFAAYLGGDSVNYVTTVGGEPVKAHLMRDRIGFSRAFATVAVHRHAEILAQWIFLSIGVGVTLVSFRLPTPARAAALAGLAFMGGLLLWFTLGLRRGAFRPVLATLSRFPPLRRWAERLAGPAEALDRRIQGFYSGGGRAFWPAVGWCFVGWCGGLVETYVILRLLTPRASWAGAFALESLSMIVNTLFVLVPARIGTAEGARAGIALLIGLTGAQGVAYGLARRGRELLWVLPGGVVLLKHHLLGVPVPRPPEPASGEEARG
jgi:hypothetical protein